MGLYYGIFLFCNQHLAPNKHECHEIQAPHPVHFQT
jgi:hypothetical protein